MVAETLPTPWAKARSIFQSHTEKEGPGTPLSAATVS